MRVSKTTELSVCGVVIALISAQGSLGQNTGNQPLPDRRARESLVIGATAVEIGMPLNIVAPALGMQYDLKRECPTCMRYAVWAKTTFVGSFEFNEQGKVTYAERSWTPEERHYSDGELGKALVTLLAGLVSNGNTTCTIDASQSGSVELNRPQPSVPRLVLRDGVIACADKKIRITSTTFNGEDSMQITEEIGTSRYAMRDSGRSEK